jgi:hypothetical protein
MYGHDLSGGTGANSTLCHVMYSVCCGAEAWLIRILNGASCISICICIYFGPGYSKFLSLLYVMYPSVKWPFCHFIPTNFFFFPLNFLFTINYKNKLHFTRKTEAITSSSKPNKFHQFRRKKKTWFGENIACHESSPLITSLSCTYILCTADADTHSLQAVSHWPV